LTIYDRARDPRIREGDDVKRLVAVGAALALVFTGVGATTASAAPADNDYAWFYTGQNYTGGNYGLNVTGQSRYPTEGWDTINSVIDQTYVTDIGSGVPVCGYGSQGDNGPFFQFAAGHSYNYVGTPFSSSSPMSEMQVAFQEKGVGWYCS
jgi:hypothetical protein